MKEDLISRNRRDALKLLRRSIDKFVLPMVGCQRTERSHQPKQLNR